MFFTLSKILWFVAAPVNALLFLLVAGLLLRFTRRRRAAKALVGVAAAGLVIIGFSPVAPLLLRSLEDRFPQQPDDIAPPTGILVLGGSTDTVLSEARGQVTLKDAATRVTAAVELARRYPDARIVFSGGTGLLLQQGHTEAEDTKRLWIALGITPDRITTEDRSRNTYENALFSKQLVEPKAGERWLLVTSAYHMPRSVGLFRAVDFPVIPYPVDFRTTDRWTDWLPPREATANFDRFDTAAREWIGLLAYRLTGKIEALFPGP